ncbi:MAG: hypothetical protein ACX936_02850 [Marinobacter sp.]
MSNAPNLIGIGGQKCASTWLSECLRSHPEIFMSSPKELRFFADNEQKGFHWYLGFFKGTASYKYRGEFSSNYIYWPDSAEKIKDTLGIVKIIAVVRDPAERALSHIKHLVRDGALSKVSGEITKSALDDILKEHPQVISNSLYQPGLKRFREVFGVSSIFVVNQQECFNNGRRVLESLWAFLGVNPNVMVGDADKVVSAGINPKYSWLEALRVKVFTFAKYRAPWLINWVKKSGLSRVYRKVNRGKELVFSQEAANYISKLCANDWRATQEMLTVR